LELQIIGHCGEDVKNGDGDDGGETDSVTNNRPDL